MDMAGVAATWVVESRASERLLFIYFCGRSIFFFYFTTRIKNKKRERNDFIILFFAICNRPKQSARVSGRVLHAEDVHGPT